MVSLHFQKSLLELDPDEANQFLFSVENRKLPAVPTSNTQSQASFFLPLVWLGRPRFELPSLSNDRKLPVVLSCEGLRRLFFAPQRLKQRGRPSQRMSANPHFEVRRMEKHIANVGGCRESAA
jgi:hypothetical protein